MGQKYIKTHLWLQVRDVNHVGVLKYSRISFFETFVKQK